MKRLQWLIEIADKKPLLFSIALLLIMVGVLSRVVQDRDNRINICQEGQKSLQQYYIKKLEQKDSFYRAREIQMQDKIESTLGIVIADYKEQLSTQKKLNSKISSTIKNNDKLINKNNTQLKAFQR